MSESKTRPSGANSNFCTRRIYTSRQTKHSLEGGLWAIENIFNPRSSKVKCARLPLGGRKWM